MKLESACINYNSRVKSCKDYGKYLVDRRVYGLLMEAPNRYWIIDDTGDICSYTKENFVPCDKDGKEIIEIQPGVYSKVCTACLGKKQHSVFKGECCSPDFLGDEGYMTKPLKSHMVNCGRCGGTGIEPEIEVRGKITVTCKNCGQQHGTEYKCPKIGSGNITKTFSSHPQKLNEKLNEVIDVLNKLIG